MHGRVLHRAKSCQYRWKRRRQWHRWNCRMNNLLVFNSLYSSTPPASTTISPLNQLHTAEASKM